MRDGRRSSEVVLLVSFALRPQFGFTLAAYEVLSTMLPMPGSEDAEAKRALTGRVDPSLGLREATGFFRASAQ